MAFHGWYNKHNIDEVILWLFFGPIITFAGVYQVVTFIISGPGALSAVMRWPEYTGSALGFLGAVEACIGIILTLSVIDLYRGGE